MITLFVNDKEHQVQSPVTIKQYLESVDIQHDKGVAVAVNDEVVPKVKWTEHRLKPLDKITIITATAGG